MLRPILILLMLGAAAAAPGLSSAAGSAGAPLAGVKVTECSRGAEPEDRFVEFRGAMRRVDGTETMGMRFALLERLGGRPAAKVRLPDLGVWRRSRPGVMRFAHRQRVLELAESSRYRVLVRYRWFDGDGQVIRKAARRSAACRQGGDLPDLVVAEISAASVPGPLGIHRYDVRLVNRGTAPAAEASVSLAVDGAVLDTIAAGVLKPGESRVLSVNGPICRGLVRAQADPLDTVLESGEAGNVLKSGCPRVR